MKVDLNLVKIYDAVDIELQKAGVNCSAARKAEIISPLFDNIDIFAHANRGHPANGLKVFVMPPLRVAHTAHPERPVIGRLPGANVVHTSKINQYTHVADKALLRGRMWRYKMEEIHLMVKVVIEEFVRKVSVMYGTLAMGQTS